MSLTIDQLEIEVQSSSSSAVKGIDALAASLRKLKSATGGGVKGMAATVQRLETLKKAVDGLGGEDGAKLKSLAEGLAMLKNCSGIKLSSTLCTQITNIGGAVRSLSGTDFGSLSELASGLSALSNAGKANLNSFISQLGRLPGVMTELSGTDIGGFSADIYNLVSALEPLTTLGKNGLTSFITQLNRFPDAAKKLNEADLDAFAARIRDLVAALEPLATQLNSVSGVLGNLPTIINSTANATNTLAVSNGRASRSYINLWAKIKLAYGSLLRIVDFIGGLINESNEYIEALNLFNVSMGEYAKEATEYVNLVSDKMGIDPKEWMRFQGSIMSITKGFGVASERAYIMSKNLTQLSYDLASFENSSFEEAFLKIQSGIAGELEPLRRYGFDLSVARLQQEALNLGIHKSVSEMTQAEKAELRYYAMMTQLTYAQGDMARTLEAPANQLRILRSELNKCARAFGVLFIPILNKVLPYVIAVVKVLREFANVIAKLFGANPLPEIDWGSVSDGSSAVGDIADSFDDATENAKKFRATILGIDELNLMADNSDSGSAGLGAGNIGGGSLGFDLPEYDFIGDSVATKVDDIVGKIKDWLGLNKEITSWSELLDTNLGKILIVVGAIGAAFAAWKLAKGFVSVANTISSLFGGGGIGGATGGKAFSIPSPKIVLKGLADLALIVGGVIALVEVLGLLRSIPGFEETAKSGLALLKTVFSGIMSIILPLTAVSVGVIALGKVGVATVAKGFADLAIIIGGIPVLITAVGALMSIPYFDGFLSAGVSSLKAAFNGIMEIALPIGVMAGVITALGFATPAVILSGIAGFALVVAGLEALLVALGALNQIPGFQWIVGEGGKLLVQLGGILGEFAGSIVSNFISKATEGFADVGTHLSEFMTNATPFFDGVRNIDEGTANAAKSLAACILALTAANVLDRLTAWAAGENSLTDFGAMLPAFGENMVAFGNIVGDGNLDPSVVEASANAAKALVELARDVPNEGGLLSWIVGENRLDEFGNQLPVFGAALTEYSLAVEGLKPDVVEASVNAASAIVALARDIPNEGGLLSWIVGDNKIGDFGAMLPAFGENLKKYSDNVKGVTPETVDASVNAANAIVALAVKIPNSGGLLSWIVGDNKIDDFGAMLPSFGENLSSYAQKVSGVKSETVTASINVAKAIIELSKCIPNMGGFQSLIVGDNTLDKFGETLPSFGENLKAYSDSVKGITSGTVEASINVARSIIELSQMIPNEGGIQSWFVGDNDLGTFGKSVEAFGKSFKSYYDSIAGLENGKLATAVNSLVTLVNCAVTLKNAGAAKTLSDFGDSLKDAGKDIAGFLDRNFGTSAATDYGKSFGKALGDAIVKALKNVKFPTIYGNASVDGSSVSFTIKAYASGGFPAMGELFVANEAGPELVGSIGRRSAVMNNSQIVESVSEGVAAANAEQNTLLREEIRILKAILAKDSGGETYCGAGDIVSALARKNRRDGKFTSLVEI